MRTNTKQWLIFGALLTALLGTGSGCGENLTQPPERTPFTPGQTPPLECVPNLDGQIDTDELPLVLDNPVSYLISPPNTQRPVDLVGQITDGGQRFWDWSKDRADDQELTVTATALQNQWYAQHFEGGDFVLPLNADGQLATIYARDDSALRILGIASVAENPREGQTLLVYEEPVTLYRFPLKPGAESVEIGQVSNATLLGLPYAGRDVYRISVDGSGMLKVPLFTFTQALRVRQHITVEPAVGASTSRRQVSFLFECFGEVARATSNPDETEENFENAAEIRRIGM